MFALGDAMGLGKQGFEKPASNQGPSPSLVPSQGNVANERVELGPSPAANFRRASLSTAAGKHLSRHAWLSIISVVLVSLFTLLRGSHQGCQVYSFFLEFTKQIWTLVKQPLLLDVRCYKSYFVMFLRAAHTLGFNPKFECC